MDLVYGDLAGNLVFMPLSKAHALYGIQLALASCKTWGELKLALPVDLYRGLAVRYCADAELDDEDDGEVPPDTWDNDEADPLLAWEPEPTTSLDYFEGLIADGDFPDWPEHDALRWMPKEVQEQFGTVDASTLNGDYLELAPKDEAAIVAALKKHGYVCMRDDELVRHARGL